jgi:hypothetical protein
MRLVLHLLLFNYLVSLKNRDQDHEKALNALNRQDEHHIVEAEEMEKKGRLEIVIRLVLMDLKMEFKVGLRQ